MGATAPLARPSGVPPRDLQVARLPAARRLKSRAAPKLQPMPSTLFLSRSIPTGNLAIFTDIEAGESQNDIELIAPRGEGRTTTGVVHRVHQPLDLRAAQTAFGVRQDATGGFKVL